MHLLRQINVLPSTKHEIADSPFSVEMLCLKWNQRTNICQCQFHLVATSQVVESALKYLHPLKVLWQTTGAVASRCTNHKYVTSAYYNISQQSTHYIFLPTTNKKCYESMSFKYIYQDRVMHYQVRNMKWQILKWIILQCIWSTNQRSN